MTSTSAAHHRIYTVKEAQRKMGDDSYSATELRRRYHMGGDLKDDHLTAPQLRARYGIRDNSAGAVDATEFSILYTIHIDAPIDSLIGRVGYRTE